MQLEQQEKNHSTWGTGIAILLLDLILKSYKQTSKTTKSKPAPNLKFTNKWKCVITYNIIEIN